MAMDQNAAEPREKTAFAVVTCHAFPRLEHRFLRQIARHSFVAAQQHRLPEQAIFIQTAQRVERCLVPAPRLLDKVSRLLCRYEFHKGCVPGEHVSIIVLLVRICELFDFLARGLAGGPEQRTGFLHKDQRFVEIAAAKLRLQFKPAIHPFKNEPFEFEWLP